MPLVEPVVNELDLFFVNLAYAWWLKCSIAILIAVMPAVGDQLEGTIKGIHSGPPVSMGLAVNSSRSVKNVSYVNDG